MPAEINEIPGGIDRYLWPEHGEGTPYCQIRVASKTFKNSQFRRQRDKAEVRKTTNECSLYKMQLKITISARAGYFRSAQPGASTVIRPSTKTTVADQASSGENGSPALVANYVAALSADLAAMARQSGLDTLGYLLEMVRLEAESVSRHKQNGHH